MKFQKMDLISAGTDFDVIRCVIHLYFICVAYAWYTEKPFARATSIKLPGSRVSESSSIFVPVFQPTCIRLVRCTALVVSLSDSVLHILCRLITCRYAHLCDLS